MPSPLLFASIAALAVAPLAPTPPMPPMPPTAVAVFEEIPTTLDWRIAPASDKAEPGSVEFTLGYHTEHHSSNWGFNVQPSILVGLTAAQLAADGAPVSFALHRDAGDMRCKGVAGQGRGVGTCVYAPDATFAAGLGKRGIATPSAYQQFQLALDDIGYAYVDELKRQQYATPSVDDLVRAGNHGVPLKVLKAMDEAGYRFPDLAALVRVRDHGVSATYIGLLKANGYDKLPAETLVRMRDHGVSAAYVTEMKSLGYARLDPDELVRLRDHGVTASYVGELKANGYGGLSIDQLRQLRDHGVSAGFIRTANSGGTRLTVEELLSLHDRGGRARGR